MRQFVRAGAHTLIRRFGLRPYYIIGKTGILREDGWFRSHREERSVDAAGNPIPWITYPATAFLARRVKPDMRVFEYGCGNGTFWWAARVSEIHSVEHDREWYGKISAALPVNAQVSFVELHANGAYSRHAVETGRDFDIIVIDGRDRVNCARHCLDALHPGGVIVWDNTDRSEYGPGMDFLCERGFKRIEFIGLCPIEPDKNETSIFYRSSNCLDI